MPRRSEKASAEGAYKGEQLAPHVGHVRKCHLERTHLMAQNSDVLCAAKEPSVSQTASLAVKRFEDPHGGKCSLTCTETTEQHLTTA